MKRLMLILALLGGLAVPAAADGRPVLTQRAADAEAVDTLDLQVGLDDYSLYAGAVATGYELDACDVDRRGAECDFTLMYEGGDVCDGTVTVKLTRRGKVVSGLELDYCDSDDAPDE